MYECESWTIKKSERWRIDAFELWCCRKLLRLPWTARRSNQSVLKEINPEYYFKDWCWSWSFSTLATWCEEPTYWKRPWCWGWLKAKGEGGQQRIRWLDSITNSMDMNLSKHGLLQSMGLQRVGHDLATEQNILASPLSLWSNSSELSERLYTGQQHSVMSPNKT